jgi:peptidoglycan/LPS O-acetylase OafA/YrhL
MQKKQNIVLVLKGFAIIIVLINHYINSYLSPNYQGYANGIIALFFVLSGYGIFYSLDKYSEVNKETIQQFLWKRCLRIFPLYWLSLFLYFGWVNSSLPDYILETVLALPHFQATGIYWFITSLIQCYLLAPLLYLISQKIGTRNYLILVIFCTLISFLIFPFTALPYTQDYFVYRYLFLGHLFLFAQGLALPNLLKVIKQYPPDDLSNKLTAIAFISFLLLVYYTRFAETGSQIAPLLIIVTPLFCCFSIYTNPQFPLKSLLATAGNYSYSLYLFHLIYYHALAELGFVSSSNYVGIVLAIAFFPCFWGVCLLLEKCNQKILKYSSKYLEIN